MKKIELSDDFFSGMERKKMRLAEAPASRREKQAIRTILGTQPRNGASAPPHRNGHRPTPGPGALLSIPFAMAGHMMALCASVIRVALPPFRRR